MRLRDFTAEIRLALPPEQVFSFFADANNLQLLTPPWLNFKILTPSPIAMHEGALIDCRLRVRGFPVRWRTRINVWQPPHRFVDEQICGPYRRWIHEHSFEPCDGSTLARDVVQYAVPFDFLVHKLLVRRDVERIFAFRAAELQKRFSPGK